MYVEVAEVATYCLGAISWKHIQNMKRLKCLQSIKKCIQMIKWAVKNESANGLAKKPPYYCTTLAYKLQVGILKNSITVGKCKSLTTTR